MILKADIANELKKYTEFLDEETLIDRSNVIRTWKYKWTEKSFLAYKTVAKIEKDEILVYDYSYVLNFKMNKDNYKHLENQYKIKIWRVGDNLKDISTMKEILENNMKSLIYAESLQKKIERFRKLEMLDELN